MSRHILCPTKVNGATTRCAVFYYHKHEERRKILSDLNKELENYLSIFLKILLRSPYALSPALSFVPSMAESTVSSTGKAPRQEGQRNLQDSTFSISGKFMNRFMLCPF